MPRLRVWLYARGCTLTSLPAPLLSLGFLPHKRKLTFLWLGCRTARCYSCLWRTCLQRAPIVTHLSTHHNLLGHSPVTMATRAASSPIGRRNSQDRPLAEAKAGEWHSESHAYSTKHHPLLSLSCLSFSLWFTFLKSVCLSVSRSVCLSFLPWLERLSWYTHKHTHASEQARAHTHTSPPSSVSAKGNLKPSNNWLWLLLFTLTPSVYTCTHKHI